jgi:hypothetical protein
MYDAWGPPKLKTNYVDDESDEEIKERVSDMVFHDAAQDGTSVDEMYDVIEGRSIKYCILERFFWHVSMFKQVPPTRF